MKEQKKLTMELVKSLMDESYTLVWTDYNDNLDNRLDLIHECLASKSQEKLWEKADEWYSDSEWEAVHEIVTRLKAECTACFHVDERRWKLSLKNTKMKYAMRYTVATIRMSFRN